MTDDKWIAIVQGVLVPVLVYILTTLRGMRRESRQEMIDIRDKLIHLAAWRDNHDRECERRESRHDNEHRDLWHELGSLRHRGGNGEDRSAG